MAHFHARFKPILANAGLGENRDHMGPQVRVRKDPQGRKIRIVAPCVGLRAGQLTRPAPGADEWIEKQVSSGFHECINPGELNVRTGTAESRQPLFRKSRTAFAKASGI